MMSVYGKNRLHCFLMIDECISKYMEAKRQAEHYEKKMEKYRKQIEQEMKTHQLTAFENDLCTIKAYHTERETISKKEVPETLWKQYAKKTQVDYVMIREKKK